MLQNHRRGLQVGEPPCGKGSGCRFGCASAPVAFRRQRQAKQRQSRMPGPPLLLKCPGARQADKARCRESKLVAIAQEDMGGQWGAKAIVASPGRGQQPKDFPQAETLRAGQLVNQASGAMPLQMKGAHPSQFSGLCRSRKPGPRLSLKKHIRQMGSAWRDEIAFCYGLGYQQIGTAEGFFNHGNYP